MFTNRWPSEETARTDEGTFIKVWAFHEAPSELRALSPHNGDEKWLALIPARMAGKYMVWCEQPPGTAGNTTIHKLPDGSEVRIGAHS